eukprot:jgi/Botrbrau1/4841/Bobra.0032s0002.1
MGDSERELSARQAGAEGQRYAPGVDGERYAPGVPLTTQCLAITHQASDVTVLSEGILSTSASDELAAYNGRRTINTPEVSPRDPGDRPAGAEYSATEASPRRPRAVRAPSVAQLAVKMAQWPDLPTSARANISPSWRRRGVLRTPPPQVPGDRPRLRRSPPGPRRSTQTYPRGPRPPPARRATAPRPSGGPWGRSWGGAHFSPARTSSRCWSLTGPIPPAGPQAGLSRQGAQGSAHASQPPPLGRSGAGPAKVPG